MGFFSSHKSGRTIDSLTAPDGVYPICPHCEHAIDAVYTREIRMPMGKTWVFCCSNCSKVIGTSQRKTVPMG